MKNNMTLRKCYFCEKGINRKNINKGHSKGHCNNHKLDVLTCRKCRMKWINLSKHLGWLLWF